MGIRHSQFVSPPASQRLDVSWTGVGCAVGLRRRWFHPRISGPLIFRLVLVESLIVGLAGGALGVGIALAVLAWGRLTVGTEGVMVTIAPSLQLGMTGLCVTAIVGILAGLVPAMQASRSSIVA